MAWYTVNYKCGHEGRINLVGKTDARYRKLDWMSSHVACEECQKLEFAAANVKAAETNAEAGLPSLSGSEKQIAWAESLRQKAYKLLTADNAAASLVSHVVVSATHFGLTPEMLKAAGIDSREKCNAIMRDAVRKLFAEQTTARFWIDSRPMGTYSDTLAAYDAISDQLAAMFVEAVKAAPQSAAPKLSVRVSLSSIMRRAWAIARDAAKEIGCALKDVVFGACLKLAWAEARA